MSERERREPQRAEEEPIVREQDSPSASEHNARMRERRRQAEHDDGTEIPAGIRTVRAIRNRRRVIE